MRISRRDLLTRLGGAALAVPALGPRPAAGAERLSVLLDWFVNPNHGPLVVAQAIGAFQRAGLDVEFVQPADPSMPPRLVAAGHGDVAVDYQPALQLQVASGLPLARIGVLVDRPMLTYTTLQGYGVTRVADLKGKRFGYNEISGLTTLAQIDVFLATGGLTRRDVEMVNVGTALSTSLLTRRVDIIGLERNFEVLELEDRGARPIVFDCERYGIPTFDNLVLVINRRNGADPRFKRFMAAVREGAGAIRAHPDAAWRLFVQAYPHLNNRLNQNAWAHTAPVFAADPAGFDEARYARFGQFMIAHGVVRSLPPVSAYVLKLI